MTTGVRDSVTRARPARPRPPVGGVRTTTTAIVLATAPAPGDRPAAALPWEGATVLRRQLEQLGDLGVRSAEVITRPGWRGALEAELDVAGLDVTVHASPDRSRDLGAVADAARAADGGIVITTGEMITHREALAGLLADPRVATGILTVVGGRPLAFRFRARRGVVVSASSPFHRVWRANTSFLGVVKVAPADRDALVAAAEQLAELTRDGLPAGWADELDRKAGQWRVWRALDLLEEAGDPLPDVPPEPDEVVLDEADEAELVQRRRVNEQDVVALLVVALVRNGAHLRVNHLRRLYWGRATTAEAIAEATERYFEFDEDKVLLDSAVKASDGFFTTFFVSPYSRYIARWCARRGFSPNQVTTVSLAIGLLSAAAFATGERWGLIAGAVLLQVAFTTDCVDGQLARYTRTFSKLGAWLDSVFDRSKEYLAFAGLAIGGSAMGEDVWALAGAAITLQTVRHSFDFSFAAGEHQTLSATPQPAVAEVDDAGLLAARARQAERLDEDEDMPQRGVARSTLSFWRRLDAIPGVLWVKRMVAFPIGERFAAISLTAALWTPHTTFVVLLAWGGFAATYSLAGRLLRAARSA